MENTRLLHAVHLTLQNEKQIACTLRHLRLCKEQAQDKSVLLLICDLPDAKEHKLPHDPQLIRCVQSGVMSMAARRPGEYFFIVRKRSYNKTLRLWLGENQQLSIRQTLFALLTGGSFPAPETSNFSPASLQNAFDAVLITHSSLCMLPDTPAAMLDRLLHTDSCALRGKICITHRREEPLFIRLYRAGFSLLPTFSVRFSLQEEPLAAIYTIQALTQPPPQDTAAGCSFLFSDPPMFGDFFSNAEKQYALKNSRRFLLPVAQMLALFASALTGQPFFAGLSILFAEAQAFLHPRQLPCALIRLSFLPRHMLIAVNAMLKKRFAQSRYMLTFSCGSGACVFFGAALLFLAVRSTGALSLLFVISLLWLFSPMIERALSLPVKERIPLDESERRQLRSLAENAFLLLHPNTPDPAHLLAACTGCMLGIVEPDEAARIADGMLPQLSSNSAYDCACILTAAQFLKERMSECDAALRGVPANLEAIAWKTQTRENGLLAALLRIAQEGMKQDDALSLLRQANCIAETDILFLSCNCIGDHPLLLPITHPHTFLKQQRLLHTQHAATEKNDPSSSFEEANRFLILASAALDAPFHDLFLQSARIAPYAPLLDMI